MTYDTADWPEMLLIGRIEGALLSDHNDAAKLHRIRRHVAEYDAYRKRLAAESVGESPERMRREKAKTEQ